jgi:UPF0755 protein
MKKIIYLTIVIILAIIIIPQTISCQSRADSQYSSFRVCLKRLVGRDNPLPEPQKKPEYTVKLLEGWSINEMANYLENEGIFEKVDFIKATRLENYEEDLTLRYSFLEDKPEEADLQGYLYPDTYRIFTDAKPQDLIIRMLDNLEKKLNQEMIGEINSQGKTIYEILTMAALIEKEAPINYINLDNYNAKIISGIFWQRIKNRQALQSCASLAYILGVNKEIYTTTDTRVESPYNTYLHPGLPAGPITNPGILAIDAAIYPINSNYNYFLTPSNTRDIIYSKTHDEHVLNKSKYLKNN